jgi:cell division protein FtsZ
VVLEKKYADDGIAELKKYVDTLLVINNEKLIEVYGDLTFTQAFGKANEVLNTATKGIAEVISQHLMVNIDLNDARRVLENSGTAVMGQAEAEGENRALEAVKEALDSPLLNDNDITGAQQVLLKIVTGAGEDEIKMSELSNIKNAIQKAAGTNVNIIEGIGIDSDLGSKVSVTVIATGFEERRKPKGQTTVILGEASLDSITSEENERVSKPTTDVQQTLSLEDNVNFSITTTINEPVAEVISTVVNDVIEPVVESHNTSEKIVFDLGNEFETNEIDMLTETEEDESPDEVISSIMLDERIQEVQQTVALDLDNDADVKEEPTLNSTETATVNTEVMKVEARERENRLRSISMQLRTPSGLTSLEDVPAYKRNNIQLEDPTHSSESEVSTYTLTNGNNNITELKQNNSFLHDNVD